VPLAEKTAMPGALPGTLEEGDKQDGKEKTLPGPFTLASLDDLIAAGQKNVDLKFEREAQVVVVRSAVSLRHEHMWERELRPSRLDDYRMLVDWGLTSRLTPAQLAFAFKKMADSLKEELQAFVEVEKQYEHILVSKARKYVEIERDIEGKTHSGDLREAELLNNTLKNYSAEFHLLCDKVPLHFLVRLQKACSEEPGEQDDVNYEAIHRETTNASLQDTKTPTAPRINDMQGAASVGRRPLATQMGRTQEQAGQPHTLRQRLEQDLHEKMSHNPQTATGVRHRNKMGIATISEDEVLKKLADKIEEHIDRMRNDAIANASATGGRSKKNAAPTTTVQEAKSDGRMTFKEFQRVMFDAGISWLNEKEMRVKFEAMDIDKSGKLNLAEVFSAATRMQHLVERARDYENKERAKGRILTQKDVMEEFSMLLLTGENLAATPGVQVTVSSGEQTLDSLPVHSTTPGAWVPSSGDTHKWIQWDFGMPCNVTSVSTRGNGEADSWATTYKVWVWRDLRKDPALSEDSITFFEMRRLVPSLHSETDKPAMTREELVERWEALELDSEANNASTSPFGAEPDLGPGCWVQYTYEDEEDPTEFQANQNSNSVFENILEPTIEATRIRLQVTNFHGPRATTRATVLGYPLDDDDEAMTGTGQAPAPLRPSHHKTVVAARAPSLMGSAAGSSKVTPRSGSFTTDTMDKMHHEASGGYAAG